MSSVYYPSTNKSCSPHQDRIKCFGISWCVRDLFLLIMFLFISAGWQSNAYAACSRISLTRSSVTFVNHTEFPVKINWVNYLCGESTYATLLPGATRVQATYVNHVWRARNAADNALLLERVITGNATVTIVESPLTTLKGVPTPAVPGLLAADATRTDIVTPVVINKTAAIALGKALFWDQAIGSDGMACASCHFHAGADFRTKNQMNPGFNHANSTFFDPTLSGANKSGPNYTVRKEDFPMDPFNDDVTSSSGTFGGGFVSATAANLVDSCNRSADPTFNVAGVGVRRVEPRNTPTTVNAVFNHRNFWDGRANNVFNGVNPFGLRDPNAKIWINKTTGLIQKPLNLVNSSLASQAVGPVQSILEMSCENRPFAAVGRKVLARKPLANQTISSTDSVLRNLGTILFGTTGTYGELVKKAFNSVYWNSACTNCFGGYTQMESNFSMFFGLAVQLYESTLVSDDSKFDRVMQGTAAFTAQEQLGFDVFNDKGNCIECHIGPLMTSAAITPDHVPLVEFMPMLNVGDSLYDEGFYNLGVVPTEFDIGLGGKDPFGNPLSFSQQASTGNRVDKFNVDACQLEIPLAVTDCFNPAHLLGKPVAVDGSFKVPTLRNVELTGPYMHNGQMSTLEQVVEFYDRGGNVNNLHKHPEIEPLGLTPAEEAGLVAFMKTLTDDRVALEKAPFDHPSLTVPNGHVGDENAVTPGNSINPSLGKDEILYIPAVGSAGLINRAQPFVDILGGVKMTAYLSPLHSGKCMDVAGGSTADGANVQQYICNGTAAQKVTFLPVTGKPGVYNLKFDTGKCLDVSAISFTQGANIYQWTCHTGLNQQFKVQDAGGGAYYLTAQHSGMVVDVAGISTATGANIYQWANVGGNNQKWQIIPTHMQFTQCALENATCSFSGHTKFVKYGAKTSYIYKQFTNGATCNNTVFSDPIVGTAKACFIN